jgi:hypothetical protein
MSLETRLKKLESTHPVDGNVCRCPDAVSLAATPYATVCFKCGEAIKIETWQSWRLFYPDSSATNRFAFGMRRDDKDELTAQPNAFFLAEVSQGLKECAAKS